MFKKSFLKRGKNATSAKLPQPKPQPVRSIDEIKAEYNQVCGLAGEEQFKSECSKAQLMSLNKRLAEIHQEYTQRQAALDAESKEPQGIKEPSV